MMKLVQFELIKLYRKKATVGLLVVCILLPMFVIFLTGPRTDAGVAPPAKLANYQLPFTPEALEKVEEELSTYLDVNAYKQAIALTHPETAYPYNALRDRVRDDGYFGSIDGFWDETVFQQMSEAQINVYLLLNYLCDYEEYSSTIRALQLSRPYEETQYPASYISYVEEHFDLSKYQYGSDHYVLAYVKTMMFPILFLLFYFFSIGSTLFAQEYQKSDSLLLSTALGKQRLYLVKMIALLLQTIVVSSGVLLCYFLYFSIFHHLCEFPNTLYGHSSLLSFYTNQEILFMVQGAWVWIMVTGSMLAAFFSIVFRRHVIAFACCFLCFFVPLSLVPDRLFYHFGQPLSEVLLPLFFHEGLVVQYFQATNLRYLPFFHTYLNSAWFPYLLWIPVCLLFYLLGSLRWKRWQIKS